MRVFRSSFEGIAFRSFYITTESEAKRAITALEKTSVTLGLDIETAKLEEYREHKKAGLCPLLSKIRLIQIYDGTNVYVFDVFAVSIELLSSLFKKRRFCAHHALFEILFLTHAGFPNINAHCSMILSQLVDGAEHSCWEGQKAESIDDVEDDEDQTGLGAYKRRKHSLDAAVSREFGVKVDKGQQDSDWGAPELSVEQITYAALDAVLTYHLAKKLFPRLKQYKMEKAYKQLKDIQHVVAEMQLTGMPVDWEYHGKMVKKWEKESKKAFKKCEPYFGKTNLNSGKQKNEWLEKYLKKIKQTSLLKTWPKTPKGAYAFGKDDVLKYVGLPAIAAYLEYRKWEKRLNTYGKGLAACRHPVTDRIHSSYTIAHTATTRFSSMEPNAQNYPNDTDFRNMFKAPKDHVLVVADFSQIELRLQAEFSKDPFMLQVYKEGRDVYCEMASDLFHKKVVKCPEQKKERAFGKQTMLSLGYGMGVPKFAMKSANAGLHYDEAFYARAHRTYRTKAAGYIRWCDQMRERANKLGYIETLGGMRRCLGQQEIYTCAPNTVIQGTAAELMRLALLKCSEKIKKIMAKICASIHDEGMLLAHKRHAIPAKHALETSMNEAWAEMFPKSVCLHVADAEAGERWGTIKEGM